MSPHQMFYHGRKGQFQRHNILISDGFQVLSTRKCRKRGPGGPCFTQMSIYQSYFLCDIFLLYNCFPAHLFQTCFDVVWAKIIQLQGGWIAQSVPGFHSVLLHIWQGPPSICRAWHHWKYGKHHTEQVRVTILFLLLEWGAENWCAFHTFNIFTPLHLYILTSSTKKIANLQCGNEREQPWILWDLIEQPKTTGASLRGGMSEEDGDECMTTLMFDQNCKKPF